MIGFILQLMQPRYYTSEVTHKSLLQWDMNYIIIKRLHSSVFFLFFSMTISQRFNNVGTTMSDMVIIDVIW
jgi:hypothetical protein